MCVQREEAQAVAGQVETRSLSYRWGNSKTKWRIIQRCSTICCHTTYDTLLTWPPDGDTYKRMQREDGSESKRHGDTNATGGKAVATEKRKRERNQTRQSTAEREQQRKSRCDSLPPLISSSRQRQRRKQHKRQQRNYKQEGNSDRGICGICRTEGGREKANPDSRGNRRTNCRSKRSTKQEPPR